ncbi:MAG: hypothetical protein F4X64_14010 [Chloroflexi bacterium]|nr:hypothetical protein [Chloroflexota bacterium]
MALAPQGCQNYLKSQFMSEVGDEVMEINLDFFDRVTSPLSSILFQFLGNATRRVPAKRLPSDTGAPYAIGLPTRSSWTRANLRSTSGGFVNSHRHCRPFPQRHTSTRWGPSEEGAAGIQAAFGDNFERLARLKQRYDPTNMFSHRRNILPRA